MVTLKDKTKLRNAVMTSKSWYILVFYSWGDWALVDRYFHCTNMIRIGTIGEIYSKIYHNNRSQMHKNITKFFDDIEKQLEGAENVYKQHNSNNQFKSLRVRSK